MMLQINDEVRFKAGHKQLAGQLAHVIARPVVDTSSVATVMLGSASAGAGKVYVVELDELEVVRGSKIPGAAN